MQAQRGKSLVGPRVADVDHCGNVGGPLIPRRGATAVEAFTCIDKGLASVYRNWDVE